jgi:thiol:disulfide interchange protein DsbC
VVAFGKKLNIRGTPTMFFADGSRVPGYMPLATLEKALDRGSAR